MSFMESAESCRKNGWQVGDKLAGDEGYGLTVILITAIGENNILARAIEHGGKSLDGREWCWTLSNRDWKKV